MKKMRCLCAMLCIVVLLSCYSMPVLATPDDSVANGSYSLDAVSPVLGTEQKVPNMQAAIVYERSGQTLMYAWNPDEPVYPSSLVKIMTAMLVIQNSAMDQVVTVSQDVLSTVPSDAVSCDLVPDEIMTVQDLLYCMMVGSANDAAAVLAENTMGSQQAFVEKMNLTAAELGCTGTNFVNVHGLHHEQQYSTARDLAKILDAAMELEMFREVFGTVEYTVPATNKSEARDLFTRNYLISGEVEIYYDSRVTGGRTGIAADGTRCIASSAEQNGLSLLTVVLGAQSQFEDDGYTVKVFGSYPETSALLDMGFTGFARTQVLYKDQAVKQCPVRNGTSDVVLGSAVEVSAVLPYDISPEQLSYRYDDLTGFSAPIQKGDVLSSLEIWHDNICVAKTELYAMNSVDEIALMSTDDTQQGASSKTASSVLIVIVCILAVLTAAVFVLRIVNKLKHAAAKKRSRRYRRNRRRSR